VLEVGCGSGVFLRAAVDRGASVAGLDASEELVRRARERVPEAEVSVGDMQALPWPDGSFDVVAGFNAFFFAADMVEALREAARVARPGAPIAIQVWGRPDRCDLTAMKQGLASVAPPPEAEAPAEPGLWEPGVLEAIATAAGLVPQETYDVSWAYTFPDEDALARSLLSPGLVVELLQFVPEDAVRTAIVERLAAHRAPDGSYSLRNEWHTLVATSG
jgi:SAM-dependent methyltransferase